MKTEFDYQIYKLSNTFYQIFTTHEYPELLNKESRPYNCLLLQTKYDYFICIPFRTNIRHKDAFHFSKSKRSQCNKSGLDYSKCVILDNNTYMACLEDNAIVDTDEYAEVVTNINEIAEEVNKYIDTYISHIENKNVLHSAEFERRYRYSTLKYFHKELGIQKN